MNTIKAFNIIEAIKKTGRTLLNTGYKVKTQKWQGIENPPEFFETLNISIEIPMAFAAAKEHIPLLSQDWVEPHFKERISGQPLNPGESYKLWPHYGSDAKVRNQDEMFSHTYMERYWPKTACALPSNLQAANRINAPNNHGIRYEYGDLSNVIDLLANELDTRQAYLPIWFPEDTGVVHGGRVPCSIGYHFIIRHNYLHVVYQLRSCDYLRHFADDLYLTQRLAETVLERVIEKNPQLKGTLKLGTLTTHITSLHIFAIEIPKVEKLL